MGLFRSIQAAFHNDWCSRCKIPMEEERQRLFAIPSMMVGHYVSHNEAGYYRRALQPVESRADIPAGMYACGAVGYRCPQCGHKAVKISVFLPVRDREKLEEVLLFERGELDALLWEE